jgi:hypothetical protein
VTKFLAGLEGPRGAEVKLYLCPRFTGHGSQFSATQFLLEPGRGEGAESRVLHLISVWLWGDNSDTIRFIC